MGLVLALYKKTIIFRYSFSILYFLLKFKQDVVEHH